MTPDSKANSDLVNPGQAQPAALNSRVEEFLARHSRGRLIFAIDATASRQPAWDLAAKLQAQMFTAADGLDVQLIYFRGLSECVASRWLSDSRQLARIMSSISCRCGETQIRRILRHATEENRREKVSALVFIGDAIEELPADLYNAARMAGMPVFLFQEGTDDCVAAIFAEIARLTGGAVARFDASAADHLADLLRAVAAFASDGTEALAAQRTSAAQLLLTQIKG